MAAQVEAISADLQSEIEEAQNASAVLIQSKKTTRTFDSVRGTALNETLKLEMAWVRRPSSMRS